MKRIAAIVLLFLAGAAQAQDREYYFRFAITDRTELRRLTQMISIDNVVRDTVYAYATEVQWQAFLALDYRPQLLGGPGLRRQEGACPGQRSRHHHLRRKDENHRRHAPDGPCRSHRCGRGY